MTTPPALLSNIQIDRVSQDTSVPSTAEGVLDLSSVLWGRPIPIFMGTIRLGGDLLWLEPNPDRATTGTWAVTFGHPLSQGDLPTIQLMFGQSILIFDASGSSANLAGLNYTFYPGSEQQLQDPTMAAVMGIANLSAFRDLAYAVYANTVLDPWQGVIPYISVVVSTRGGPLPISDYILALAARTELVPNVDIVVQGVADTIEGALITQQTTLRDELTHLREVYDFDIIDGDIITIKRVALDQNITIAAVIDFSEFVVGSTDSVELQEPAEVPTSFRINYLDPSVDYNSVPMTAHRSTFPLPVDGTSTNAVTTVDLSLAMEAGTALTLAKAALDRLWRVMEVMTFELPTKYYHIECGDVIQISYPSATYLAKVTAQTLTAQFTNKITAKSLFTMPLTTAETTAPSLYVPSYPQIADAGSVPIVTIVAPANLAAPVIATPALDVGETSDEPGLDLVQATS